MKRYSIVRKKDIGGSKAVWLPVGKLTLWPAQGDKKESGKLQINIFGGDEFHVFPDEGYDANRKESPKEETDPNCDIPFPGEKRS